jgi:hypothetical protein
MESPNSVNQPDRYVVPLSSFGQESAIEIIKKIAFLLHNTADNEITCDQFFDLIDQYADLELHGEQAAELMPLFKLHLDLCVGCHEEYDALIRLLNHTLE